MAPVWPEDDLNLTELSLEDLVTTRVSLASRGEEALFGVPAAAAVITGGELRRSGVTSIAEALRLVPGMQVVRLDGSKWAISARGNNSRFANNLLVQIDGRSVYTPVFSGVYWEAQDLLLEDVERIEVIRGPGATLWGANAFTGIVNIVTKSAARTRGTLVSAGVGTEERAFAAVRHGGRLGAGDHFRIDARFFDRDENVDLAGRPAGDQWRGGRVGLRADWTLASEDRLMVQAAAYSIDQHGGVELFSPEMPFVLEQEDAVDLDGAHVLGRWERRLSATDDMALLVYFDRTRNRELYLEQRHHTFDVDFQHRFSQGPRHEVVWGSEFRLVDEDLDGSFTLSLEPDRRWFTFFSAFAQDDISFRQDRVHLILGAKLEHNPFTGVEVQPAARVLWAPRLRQSLWAAVSRAVRVPSRVENAGDLVMGHVRQESSDLPIFVVGSGSESLRSQKVISFEVGYRVRPAPSLFLDLATYLQFIDDVVETRLAAPEIRTSPDRVVMPAVLDNSGHATASGVEMLADWEIRRGWRLQGTYSYLNLDRPATPVAGTIDNSPSVLQLRSRSKLSDRWMLDATARYVSRRPRQEIDGYATLDARVAYRARHGIEIAVVGQNLLESQHLEGVNRLIRYRTAQIERGIYAQIRWER